MKKAFILVMILLSGTLYSQTQFGVILDANYANVKTNDLYGIEGNIGYHRLWFWDIFPILSMGLS